MNLATTIKSKAKNMAAAIVRSFYALKRPSKQSNQKLMQQRDETLEDIIIRDVTMDDIPALAKLHAKAWAETYPLVRKPPTAELREWQWREIFKNNDGNWFCIAVANKREQLIGFAKGQRYAHENLPDFSGELNKIYLLKQYQRLGLGKKLMCTVAIRLLNMGINNMVLFGTQQNPTCRFHEAMGGERLYAKNGEFHGGYAWRDLDNLINICQPV